MGRGEAEAQRWAGFVDFTQRVQDKCPQGPGEEAGLGLEQFPASSKPVFIGSAPSCRAEFVKAISLAWRVLSFKLFLP